MRTYVIVALAIVAALALTSVGWQFVGAEGPNTPPEVSSFEVTLGVVQAETTNLQIQFAEMQAEHKRLRLENEKLKKSNADYSITIETMIKFGISNPQDKKGAPVSTNPGKIDSTHRRTTPPVSVDRLRTALTSTVVG